MANDLSYTGFWVPSSSIPNYLEYVFPSDEDFEPALKKRRLQHENASNATTSVWLTHEPQCCEIQGPFTSVLRPQKQEINLKEDRSNEIKDSETRLKKSESTEQQEHSPTWEDFFQYMVSQDPALVVEPVIFTYPISESVNFTVAPVASHNPKRGCKAGRRSQTQSTMVVQGNKVRYSCNICTKTVPTERGLKIHKHIHKTDGLKITSPANTKASPPGYQTITEHSCYICTKTFPTTRELRIHEHTHKTHDMKITSSANTKKNHGCQALTENHKHNLGHKSFICPLCDRGFNFNKDRLNHLVTKCVKADRILRRIMGGWECTTCDKLYSSHDQAVHHIRSHEHGQRMTCPVCCKDLSGYKGHILVKHVNNRHPEYFSTFGC